VTRPAQLLADLCLLLVLYFAIFPLALLFGHTLSGSDPLAIYHSALMNPASLTALAHTARIATGTAAVAAILGFVLAWLLTATDLPGARAWRTMLSLPYAVPAYIVALAWTYLASGRSGWLSSTFPRLEIYSATGIIWVMGVAFAPVVLMGVAEALLRIDAAAVEAARLCGATSWQAFRDVVWPMVRRPLLGSTLLVFLGAAASFGVPALLGPSARPPVRVVTTRIKGFIDLHSTRGFAQAAALSSVLFLLTLLFPLAAGIEAGGRHGATRPVRPVLHQLGAFRTPIEWLVAGIFALTVLLPFGALLLASFLGNVSNGPHVANFTLRHWRMVMVRADTVGAIANSLAFSAAAATLAVLVGGLLAYGEARSESGWAWVPGAVAAIPFATPGTVVAIGLILALTGRWGLNLFGTGWMLIAAYSVKELSVAHRLVRDGLAEVHPSLEEAARLSGATWGQAMRDILLPQLKGPLTAAWFLVFLPSFGELTMSVLLTGPDTQTVGTLLFELSSYEDPAAAAVLAVIVMALVITGNGLVRYFSRGRYGI
jgi:iron(III) transport system permease protein